MALKKSKMPKEQTTPFKELPLGEKIAYIFGYYKYHMLACVILGCIIASIVYFYRLNDYDSVCYIAVVDGPVSGYEDRSDAITAGFTKHLGIDGEHTRVVIDYNYSLVQNDTLDQEFAVSQNKLYLLSSTASLDGYLADIDYIDYFNTDIQPFFWDLREILTADELDKIGEEHIIYYTNKNDRTTYPIAVNLTDTKIKQTTDIRLENPCYGVVITAPNKDNAVEFIRYAFDL